MGEAPFDCTLCHEKFGTQASTQRHKQLKRHVAKIPQGERKDCGLVSCNVSQTDSEEQLREALDSISKTDGLDILHRVMRDAGLDPLDGLM